MKPNEKYRCPKPGCIGGDLLYYEEESTEEYWYYRCDWCGSELRITKERGIEGGAE